MLYHLLLYTLNLTIQFLTPILSLVPIVGTQRKNLHLKLDLWTTHGHQILFTSRILEAVYPLLSGDQLVSIRSSLYIISVKRRKHNREAKVIVTNRLWIVSWDYLLPNCDTWCRRHLLMTRFVKIYNKILVTAN